MPPWASQQATGPPGGFTFGRLRQVPAHSPDLSAQFSLASWSASTRSSTSRAVSNQNRATLTMICRSLGHFACSAHSRQVRQNCITLSFFTMVVAPEFGRAAQPHKLFKRCDIGATSVARPYICGATSCPPIKTAPAIKAPAPRASRRPEPAGSATRSFCARPACGRHELSACCSPG